MNALAQLPMGDLIRKALPAGGARSRLLNRLMFADTWAVNEWLGPFPSLSTPACDYVIAVWPAKMLAIKGFGRQSLRAFENVLAAANLSLPSEHP